MIGVRKAKTCSLTVREAISSECQTPLNTHRANRGQFLFLKLSYKYTAFDAKNATQGVTDLDATSGLNNEIKANTIMMFAHHFNIEII